tara:strand:+ start:111 stop:608 length:498 start_codon:yes stop_codon:yes gene_type:complete
MSTERLITKRDEKGRVLEYTFLVDGKEVPEGSKYCNSCSSVKNISLFSSRGGSCKECANARARNYYAGVKEDAIWLQKRNKKVTDDGQQKKQRAVDFLGGKCIDCSGVFPLPVYDFHHLDPSVKEYNLGDRLRKKDFSGLEQELKKCVLLCANCHRIRHFTERDK